MLITKFLHLVYWLIKFENHYARCLVFLRFTPETSSYFSKSNLRLTLCHFTPHFAPLYRRLQPTPTSRTLSKLFSLPEHTNTKFYTFLSAWVRESCYSKVQPLWVMWTECEKRYVGEARDVNDGIWYDAKVMLAIGRCWVCHIVRG